MPVEPPHSFELRIGDAKKIRAQIDSIIDKLRTLSQSLDPIKQPKEFFDPANPHRIGEMIAGALVLKPAEPLSAIEKFYGSGVYALYYKGDFIAYKPISGKDHPIYVGKADPADLHAVTPEGQGVRLYSRLADHAKSIRAAKNLNIEKFTCRYLVTVSSWHKSAEDHLISRFRPIWNNEVKICFGFGKHGDSSDTRRNVRSPWDTLHPGRPWALSSKANARSPEDIIRDIQNHFKNHPIAE